MTKEITKLVQARITKEDHRRLVEIYINTGISVANLLRIAIREYLDKQLK